jgi:hypothetical protein
MIDRYPHSDQCPVRPLLARKNGMPCSCGATALQSAFEAGQREADARAMAVVERCLALNADDGNQCMFCNCYCWPGSSYHRPHADTCPLIVGQFITKDGVRRG